MSRLPRFARTDQGSLLAAIVALLIAGVTAAILHPTGPAGRSFPREAGALLAPPSESAFTDEWGRPGAPAAERAGSSPVPGPPDGTPSPQPAPPAPVPPPGAPDEPPGEGLLPDLPILPPLPPPLSICCRMAYAVR